MHVFVQWFKCITKEAAEYLCFSIILTHFLFMISNYFKKKNMKLKAKNKGEKRTCKSKRKPKIKKSHKTNGWVHMKYCMTCLIVDLFVSSFYETATEKKTYSPVLEHKIIALHTTMCFAFFKRRLKDCYEWEAYACERNSLPWNQLTVRWLNIVSVFACFFFFSSLSLTVGCTTEKQHRKNDVFKMKSHRQHCQRHFASRISVLCFSFFSCA